MKKRTQHTENIPPVINDATEALGGSLAGLKAIQQFINETGVLILPAINKRPIQSFSMASNDAKIIESWFLNVDENRRYVSLPTGHKNNVIVVDCDIKNGKDGLNDFHRLCEAHGDVPSPVYQTTPSGGRHYFYRFHADPDIRNFTELKIDGKPTGIDIKANDVSVTIDPAKMHGYEWYGKYEDRPAFPEWFLAYFRTSQSLVAPPSDKFDLSGPIRILKKAGQGKRNDTLNKVCYSLGRFIAGKVDSYDYVHRAMLNAAIEIGLEPDKSDSTINSGLKAGIERGPFDEGNVPDYLGSGEPLDEEDIAEQEQLEYAKALRLPPLPYYTLPDKLAEAVKAIADAKNASPAAVFGYILSLASACLGRARIVEYNGSLAGPDDEEDGAWREIPNLFTLIVGETGSGKSYIQKYIFRHLERREGEKKRQYQIERKEYEEKMARWKKDKDSDKPSPEKDRPRNTQYIIDDATIESVAELIEDNPRGILWWQDEMSYFFDRLDRYNKRGGSAKARVLQCYDSAKWSITRRTKDGISNEMYYESVTVSILGGIQPHLMPTLFTPQDVAQGVPQRFLFIRAVMERPPVLPTKSVPSEVGELIRKITDRLLDVQMMSGAAINKSFSAKEDIVQMEEAAARIFENFHNTCHREEFSTNMRGYVSKYMGMTLRVALIMHYLDSICNDRELSSKITPSTMNATVGLMGWLMTHTKKCMSLMPDPHNPTRTIEDEKNQSNPLEVALAEALMENSTKIINNKNFVSAKEIKTWLLAQNLAYKPSVVKNIMLALGAKKDKKSSEGGANGFTMTPKAFAKCRALGSYMQTILESEGSEDDDEE